jgi:Fe2+ transport system protein FeoA
VSAPGTLAAARSGDATIVTAVEASPARIDKLAALGIVPGVELRVRQTRPVVIVEHDESVLALEHDLASAIRVALATTQR